MNVYKNIQAFSQVTKTNVKKQISFHEDHNSQVQQNVQLNCNKYTKLFSQFRLNSQEKTDSYESIRDQKHNIRHLKYNDGDSKNKKHIQTKKIEGYQKIQPPLSEITRGLSLIHQNTQYENNLQFSSFFAWFLLVVHAFGNAVVPCWMTIQINGDGFPKTIWRSLIIGILLIPFLMYEQRNIKQSKYKLKNLLNRQNLKRYWLYSFKNSIWVLFGSYAIKFTSRAHSFYLLRLKFLLMTINKLRKKEKYHEAQIGGLFLTLIGITMLLSDSYFLPQKYTENAPYTNFSILSRFSGDLLAVIGSLIILYFDCHYQMPKDPEFTCLFIYNNCLTLNLIVLSYFFVGCQLNFSKPYGLLRLFEAQVFVEVFYVSIMLGLNLLIGSILINKIFSDFIRKVASCFQIVIMTTIYHLFSIQVITSGLTYLSLSFLVPGMMLIIGGQNILQNRQIKINLTLMKKIESKRNLKTLQSLKQIDEEIKPFQFVYLKNLKKSLHKSHQIISLKEDEQNASSTGLQKLKKE